MRSLSLIVAFMTLVSAGQAQQIAKTLSEDITNSEKLVKGIPFTADAMTNSTQILVDGTRIDHTSTSKLYRDAEGRFRRDDSPQNLNIPGANVEIPASILILDPIAGCRYLLNSSNHTYHKFNYAEAPERGATLIPKIDTQVPAIVIEPPVKDKQQSAASRASLSAEGSSRNKASAETSSILPAPSTVGGSADNSAFRRSVGPRAILKTESLGNRMIEGVNAEGTLTTATIPSGTIGNDRPITITYEKWFSNEIMMTVHSKQVDPRFGEQSYRLTNIGRSEPEASVFTVPFSYTKASESGEKLKPPAGGSKPSPKTMKPLLPDPDLF